MSLRLFILLLAGVSACGNCVANAQSWPTKPIRWIVPYAPGGVTDVVTRMMAPRLQEALGQPVIIENKAGSNSIIGSEIVAGATPDGSTFGTVIAAHAANATLYAGRLPFDTEKSFSPVALVGIAPLIMASGLGFAPRDIKELIAFVKANPGKVSFGSSGIGSAAHLTTELLKQTVGIDMLHVPYKGSSLALQAMMGGEIQVLVDTVQLLMPQIRGGKVRGQGLFSAKRLPSAAEVPTIAEAGGPPIESSTWILFLAPARTPPDIVTRLSVETAKIVASPELRGRLEEQGVEPVGSTPEEARRFLATEIAKWAKVIKAADVKVE